MREQVTQADTSLERLLWNNTQFRHPGNGIDLQEEELITEQEYVNLTKLIDPKTDCVGKERICFLWSNQYCELDSYKGKCEGIAILKVEPAETARDAANIHIPPFITVDRNITGDPRYNERYMAMKQKKKT